jgi:hypothetical protein
VGHFMFVPFCIPTECSSHQDAEIRKPAESGKLNSLSVLIGAIPAHWLRFQLSVLSLDPSVHQDQEQHAMRNQRPLVESLLVISLASNASCHSETKTQFLPGSNYSKICRRRSVMLIILQERGSQETISSISRGRQRRFFGVKRSVPHSSRAEAVCHRSFGSHLIGSKERKAQNEANKIVRLQVRTDCHSFLMFMASSTVAG